ncbi:hypothetical protein VDGD_20386 [Verticillium dahliae]|nr:hypothetical protein VDGD_20386 [Verticillium dahliae]
MATPGARKVRAGVIAACFAAVVFTGAIYGAGIKTQQEWTEVWTTPPLPSPLLLRYTSSVFWKCPTDSPPLYRSAASSASPPSANKSPSSSPSGRASSSNAPP